MANFKLKTSFSAPYRLRKVALYVCGSGHTPLRMLRLSLPQNGSILGSSSPSAAEEGLRSGDEGMGGACCSCGVFVLFGGGEAEGGGGDVVVGVGVWGVWAEVGLLVVDWEWLTAELDRGLVRSRPPTLPVIGE